MLAVGLGVLGYERFQGGVVTADQTVAPALQRMEALVVLARRGVQLIDQRENGIDILVAHQLTDVLDVPFARDMRLVFRRVGQRLLQRVAQRQASDEVRLEGS